MCLDREHRVPRLTISRARVFANVTRNTLMYRAGNIIFACHIIVAIYLSMAGATAPHWPAPSVPSRNNATLPQRRQRTRNTRLLLPAAQHAVTLPRARQTPAWLRAAQAASVACARNSSIPAACRFRAVPRWRYQDEIG